MNIPTRESVEAAGGTYWGHFTWPLKQEESAEFHAFKTPKGQLRHECPMKKERRVVVYSLPYPNTQKEAA